MFTEGIKRSAVFVANATRRFMNRMVRRPHVFHEMFFLVELPITPSTLVPASMHTFLSLFISQFFFLITRGFPNQNPDDLMGYINSLVFLLLKASIWANMISDICFTIILFHTKYTIL